MSLESFMTANRKPIFSYIGIGKFIRNYRMKYHITGRLRNENTN